MQQHIQVIAGTGLQIKEIDICSTFLRFALGSPSD